MWAFSGETPKYYVIINSSGPKICIHSLEAAKYLSLCRRISSRTLIMPSFSCSSRVLIGCSSRTRQIQQTIPLSADVKRHYFARCWSCLTTIQQAPSNTGAEDVIPFLSEIPRLVMIGNSCLKPFHASYMYNHKSLHRSIEKLAQLRICLHRHVLVWNSNCQVRHFHLYTSCI